MDLEAGLRAGGGGEPRVVRPAAPGRDERVGALGERRADQELEVAQLVAAERERQQVLALDPELGAAAERGRQPRQRAAAATGRRTGGAAAARRSRAGRVGRWARDGW